MKTAQSSTPSHSLTAFQYLRQMILWRFSPKKYIGKRYWYNGRKRKVIGETFRNVLFEGLIYPVPKSYILTISKPRHK